MKNNHLRRIISIVVVTLVGVFTTSVIFAYPIFVAEVDLVGKVYQKGDIPPNDFLDSLRFTVENHDLGIPDKTFSPNEDGIIPLGSYNFYTEGTYTLTISQNPVNNEKYKDDRKDVKVVIVVVFDETSQQLTANIEYMKNDKQVNEIYFENTYMNNQDVVIESQRSNDSLNPGNIITEEIKISNPSKLPIYGIYIRKYIPKDCMFESISGDGGSYGAIQGREHGTWFIPILNGNESLTLSLKFKINICVSKDNDFQTKFMYEVTNKTDIIYTNDPVDPKQIVEL